MPTYEFLCRKCNKKFEEKFGIKQNAFILICPHCNKLLNEDEFEKLISQSSFTLKWDTNY